MKLFSVQSCNKNIDQVPIFRIIDFWSLVCKLFLSETRLLFRTKNKGKYHRKKTSILTRNKGGAGLSLGVPSAFSFGRKMWEINFRKSVFRSSKWTKNPSAHKNSLKSIRKGNFKYEIRVYGPKFQVFIGKPEIDLFRTIFEKSEEKFSLESGRNVVNQWEKIVKNQKNWYCSAIFLANYWLLLLTKS